MTPSDPRVLVFRLAIGAVVTENDGTVGSPVALVGDQPVWVQAAWT